MNKARLKELIKVYPSLITAREVIEQVYKEEREALDNIPERLQETDRYYDMEDNVSDLDDAADSINTIINAIENIIQR